VSLASDDRGNPARVEETSARERRAAELFKSAIGLDEYRRAAFVAAQCAGDEAMRTRVERLLRLDVGHDSFAPQAPRELGLCAGSLIGRYRIVKQIAVGGMGAVYEAIQEQPSRVVALKFLRAEIASTSALRRFEYEAQVLARLRHPGIAQIYEAGQHAFPSGCSLPFFAMEYIEAAKPITLYVADERPTLRGRLELFLQACAAVHHGHLKGVIHRDLKPSNILVDGGGDVKLIDFGVARCVDSDPNLTTMQTTVGQLVGTLQYMSPEQCDGNPQDLDTRSDVYSLGVVLYELLCARLPYDLEGLPMHEATLRIRERSPARPSSIDRMLRGDLETIVLKTLEKDPELRYSSARSLAQDVEAFLAQRPISARPPNLVYQLRSFARRNRMLVLGSVVLLVSLVAGLIGTSRQAVRARRAESDALAEARRSRTLLESLTNISHGAERHGRDVSVLEVIEDAAAFTDGMRAPSPWDEVDYRYAIGNSLFDLGQPLKGERFLLRARELRAQLLGPSHPQTVECDSRLASHLLGVGRTCEAARLAESSVATLEALRLPRDDVILLRALAVLSEVREARGEHQRNASLCGEILARAGPDFVDRCTVGFRLMNSLAALGRFDEAEAFAEQRLRAAEFTADGLETVDWPAAIIQARCARGRGDWPRAFAFLEHALASLRRAHGDEHIGAAQLWRELGWQHTLQGNFSDAAALYRLALQQGTRLPGAEFAATADMQQLAWALLQQARQPQTPAEVARANLAEAEDLHRRVIAILERGPGPDPEYSFKAMNQLAWFLLECGRALDAEPIARAAVEGYRGLETSSDGNKVATIDTLAVLLRDRGEIADAELLFVEALGLAAATPPSGATLVPEIELHLGELLLGARRFDEASLLLGSSERALARIAPAGEVFHRQALARLAELAEARGDAPAALAYRNRLEAGR